MDGVVEVEVGDGEGEDEERDFPLGERFSLRVGSGKSIEVGVYRVWVTWVCIDDTEG